MAALNVYGTYLHLTGEQLKSINGFDLKVFVQNGNSFQLQPAFPVPVPKINSNGGWDLELALPKLNKGAVGRLLAMANSSTTYDVSMRSYRLRLSAR